MNLPLNTELDIEDFIENARFNMIEQQIRPWNVKDEKVLNVLAEVKRENFVPEKHLALAFADIEVPLSDEPFAIDKGLCILPPKITARMLNDLKIKPTDRVLEIGTGSGYFAALLSKLARKVSTTEINENLISQAEINLKKANCKNVKLYNYGNLGSDISKVAKLYDVIILSGSVEVFPEHFFPILKNEGKLACVIGDSITMSFKIFTKSGESFTEKSLWDTIIPKLQNFKTKEKFNF